MKTTLLLLFLLWAAATFVQTAPVLANLVQIVQNPDHPEHAAQHPLACERPLVGGGPGTYTTEHGDRPLWEFGPLSEQPSLGDVARSYRKEKLTAKKAGKVLEKQGS